MVLDGVFACCCSLFVILIFIGLAVRDLRGWEPEDLENTVGMTLESQETAVVR